MKTIKYDGFVLTETEFTGKICGEGFTGYEYDSETDTGEGSRFVWVADRDGLVIDSGATCDYITYAMRNGLMLSLGLRRHNPQRCDIGPRDYEGIILARQDSYWAD